MKEKYYMLGKWLGLVQTNTAVQKNENAYKIMLAIAWGIILCWRFYILLRYCFLYVDDDQAIMWYATVHFAHGNFPEPCFFGQDYNVMLEALLAVPLYKLGWPLHIALPTVTSCICIFPYFLCSCLLFKKKNYVASTLTVFLLGISGWQWDILTSIPRAWISGYPFVILGALLINDEQNRAIFKGMGSFLSMIGCAFTLSALAILGIATLNFGVVHKKRLKDYISLLVGGTAGAMLYVYQKLFYMHHPDYMITKSSVSFVTNREEVARIFRNAAVSLAQSFCLGEVGRILIPAAIILLMLYYFRRKRYQAVILIVISVCGSIFVMFLGWMNVFWEGSILYGQLRMVLFWNFLALTVITLVTMKEMPADNPLRGGVILLAGILLVIIGKGILFDRELSYAGSALFEDEMVEVMPVKSLKRQAEDMMVVADALDADVLVTTARARVFTYGVSALYYDASPVFFVPDNDRRTWIYREMCREEKRRLVLYSLPVDENMQLGVVDVEGKSIAAYFYENYGIYRGTGEFWGIHQKME